MVWKELQEHRNTKKRKKKKKKQTLEAVISTLASIFYLHFSQTATVGFLLHVLYVFFWLKGWRFSLPDLRIWCGPSIWCTSPPVYRWPPRSSAFGAVTSRALGTEYPGCQGSRLHSLLSSYWGRLFTHVIVFSFPLITFHRLTNRGQVGDRDYWRKGDTSVFAFSTWCNSGMASQPLQWGLWVFRWFCWVLIVPRYDHVRHLTFFGLRPLRFVPLEGSLMMCYALIP